MGVPTALHKVVLEKYLVTIVTCMTSLPKLIYEAIHNSVKLILE